MSEEHVTGEGAPTQTDESTETGGTSARDLARYANYVALAALLVLALVAGIQFYTAVSRTITRWVTDDYRPIVHAAFNLAVLLIATAGVSRQIRRIAA